VRLFFETYFQPVEVLNRYIARSDGPARGRTPMIEDSGVFTGYFEPVYDARRSPSGRFSAPLYARPDDLIDVELGAFRKDLAGARVSGRLEGARLVPYADRDAINKGALQGRAETLAFLDPNDLFFLQIQGSGRIVFPDGAVERIGYDGANGRPYAAIGRVLVERGDMKLEDASMQSIRAWLESAAPEDAAALREANPSYVFFRELPAPAEGAELSDSIGPLGAQGVPLTPERSLAVDRRFHAMGAPVFVDIEPVEVVGPNPIRRLMIAQDTGGAIRGPVRGDVFWGLGDEAGARAGAMNARGRMFVLLPKSRAEALARRVDP
jgi:membrane-bound lytic murein transglycosylase A